MRSSGKGWVLKVWIYRVVSRGRLRWYGHVERKAADDWVSKCRSLEVEGNVRKGRGKKAWMECVATDMKGFDLKKGRCAGSVTME